MKKYRLPFSILFFILSMSMMAQKKQFTLEDLNPSGANYKAMSPKKLTLWWDGKELVNSDNRTSPVVYPRVYSRDYNIFIKESEGAEERQVTFDGNREIVYGEAVHRNEFGINSGIFLSPDKKRFAFYRMDQSMVTDYPQVNNAERIAVCEPDKYPMAGMASHKVTIGIYTIKTGRTEWLQLGDVTDRYFTNFCWAPDGRLLYLIELNRDQTDCSLDAYDTSNGVKVRTLYTEHDDKYVEPMNPISFLPWDATRFLLWSQKDGYMHLYLMDTEGTTVRQLTSGPFVVQEILGYCRKTGQVIIRSNELSPVQSNLWAVDVETSRRTLLDNGIGVHSGMLSEDGLRLLDCYSAPDIPRVYETIDILTGERKEYYRSPDPWEEYAVPMFRNGMLKAADGITDLFYRMVLPPDFDESKQYPAIVYVYGGPHVHLVEASWHWMSRGWEAYMAQKGYVVFILDGRGSENRGKAFEQVTFRQLGQEEMRDQMKGVDFLRTLPYIDANRLGVHGWSFGGFMTISLMTNYPDVFKVAVAGGPVIDWKYYEVMYGERYMDTPEQNPEGYEKTSLLGKAGELKGRLLVITGMNDPVVVPQHTMRFIHECNIKGTYPDMYVYPGQEHNMKGKQAVHLHEKITRYFEDYLK